MQFKNFIYLCNIILGSTRYKDGNDPNADSGI